MKKMSPLKRIRNILAHPFGPILSLIGLISVATLVSPPVGLAQVNPSWIPTGSLNIARRDHTATLLDNGKVLVVGGASFGNSFASSELYDPATGTWSFTGSLDTPRVGHTATLLQNGKVLVAGGDSFGSSELYDPATGKWSITGNLHIARSVHTATLLQNGKVLVAGGYPETPYFDVTNSAELYDPATGTWTITDSLNTPRTNHTATLLQNGKVLVVGGMLGVVEEYYVSLSAVADAELYDPATGTWSNTGNLNSGRFYHTATLLPNGEVLVVGGAYPGPPVGPAPPGAYKLVGLNSAELYDPATGRWSYTGELNALHAFHTTTLLQNGKVLIVAGTDSISNFPTDHGVTSEAELYSLATGTWSVTGNLNVAREFHTATLLQNGQVLIAGGDDAGNILNSAELYNSHLSAPLDFDGDGKSDIGVYRDGVWLILRSSDGSIVDAGWGGPSWMPMMADYDGDGKADIAVYNANGLWSIVRSSDGGNTLIGWSGAAGDIPVPADYDGDGKVDLAVYNTTSGGWSIIRSSDGGLTYKAWGGPAWIPVVADYDGDGKADIAVYNANGLWSIVRSSDGGNTLIAWSGAANEIPVPADYDGDGKADLAVYNSASGGWSIIRSSDGSLTYKAWGGPSWEPVVADYDGDGKADIAVYNPGNGLWSIVRSSDGGNTLVGLGGTPDDIPLN
jgi:N-acetylneuraminic acid mutarotase